MNRRLLLFLARVQNNEPRALARLDRLQLYAAGLAGCAAGGAIAVILAPAFAFALQLAGHGWR